MKTVVVVCKDVILNNVLEQRLKDIYRVAVFNNMTSALDYIYNSIPNLLIINIADNSVGVDLLNDLKSDPMFNHLPVLAVLPENFTIADWGNLQAEDYIRLSQIEIEFLARVKLSIFRSEKIVEINPLTRLPGNISINKEIQQRIDKKMEFSFGYADLDYFKPFNDRYGFSRGDEVIKMTGRIVLGVVKSIQPQGSFVGHIGGDDFVFIVDPELMENAASEIVRAFDSLIPGMYDPDDLKLGYIQSFDRAGKASQFPMMGISIGIAETHNRTFTHYGEITQIAADMKKFAKCWTGSCFKTDQRLEGKKILSV